MTLKVIAGSMMAVVALLVCALAMGFASGNESVSIIPRPAKLEQHQGNFALGPKTRILSSEGAKDTAQYLAEKLRAATGYEVPVRVGSRAKAASGAIVLTTEGANASLGQEGYELEVNPKSVVIRASKPAGLFYAAQTFLQVLPAQILSPTPIQGIEWKAPCLRIEDQPRFAWRGVLLDVARHFFSVRELERYIDEMALHKMNVLQLHLTDDQGWRIEIKKHPRLTEIGAWRKSIGFNLDPKSSTAYGPDGRYGGYYSQDDIKNLVAYAKRRHVTILPEIEMPGHASAALAAYPKLSCSGGPYSTDMSAALYPGVFCAANEETYQLIDDVLTEVAQLFPGRYIHIGGDEVNKENWHKCPKCQALMRQKGLRTEHELQSYFIRRVESIVNAKGKRLVGWSEIREGGLAQNATVMDWIGGAVEAASEGHDVIMSPTAYCYLDYYQSRNRTNEPPAIGAFLPLKAVYSFEPIPPNLDPKFRSHILGAQGNVWTEYIASLKHVEYMTFPRLCALSEVTWSDSKARDWDDFVRRLEAHTHRLEAAGINYRKGFFEQ
jgi:hexosaminidase